MTWPITCMSAQAYSPLMCDRTINTNAEIAPQTYCCHLDYKYHNAHHRLLQQTAQKQLNKRKECVCVRACTHACVHEYWCGCTNASVPCHGSKKWDKVHFSIQLCTSILPTFCSAAYWTLQTHTDCHGQVASTLLSQLGGSGFRPQLTDKWPWFSQFSLVHLGNCQENTSNHAMTTSLPILSNSLFFYSLSLHESLRYQLHC
jgi:hypothetical protein